MGSYVACSNVKFSGETAYNPESTDQCTKLKDGTRSCRGSHLISGGKVDVLLVNDNSASMSFEQDNLAIRFDGFLDLLENKFIDYRLAMTTTDISNESNPPRTVNRDGALQNGNLIPLKVGGPFMTYNTATPQERRTAFAEAIRRKETLSCEKFITQWSNEEGKSSENQAYRTAYKEACPSTDERGIYATHLVVKNNPSGFIRDEADLDVIVLSDEDVRSQLYRDNEGSGFDLEPEDKPQTLIDLVKSKYPTKKFTFHSIITKSEVCLQEQRRQLAGTVSGTYGYVYDDASKLTGGVSGNICAEDYTSQLKDIFNNIQSKVKNKEILACSNPKNLKVQPAQVQYEVKGAEIFFANNITMGTQVEFFYECSDEAK